MKKTLVFHFFIPDDYETNIAIKIHYACLEKYCGVFDVAEFFIASTEYSRRYIDDVKARLLRIFKCKDIRFAEVENSEFYEAKTFKEQIIDRLEQLNSLVFFGHTKGTIDVNGKSRIQNILMWIYGMYFYNLEFIAEAEIKLIKGYQCNLSRIFGAFCQSIDRPDKAYYAGTFYWLNAPSVYNDVKSGKIYVPKLSSRFYGENFPFVYCLENGVESRMSRYTGFVNLHECNMEDVIREYGDYDCFMEGYNEIIEKIK